MFCKVCFDAGKPKSEYGSHFVKDKPGKDGKVVCPHLLSLNCRYCKKPGHTIGHCDVLARKDARKAQPNRSHGGSRVPRSVHILDDQEHVVSYKKHNRKSKPEKKSDTFEVEVGGRFGGLTNEEVAEKESGPSKVEVKTPQLTGWAKIAAQVPPPPPSAPPLEDDYMTTLPAPTARKPGIEYAETWEVGAFRNGLGDWGDEMHAGGSKSAWDSDSEDE